MHGGQEGSAYNGHFCSRCYHPVFVFNQYVDCERATLAGKHRWFVGGLSV